MEFAHKLTFNSNGRSDRSVDALCAVYVVLLLLLLKCLYTVVVVADEEHKNTARPLFGTFLSRLWARGQGFLRAYTLHNQSHQLKRKTQKHMKEKWFANDGPKKLTYRTTL